RKTANRQVELAKNEYERAKNQLKKNVSSAYFDIVCLQCKLKKLSIIDSTYEGYSKAAKQKFEAGEISKLDLLNAQSKHSTVKMRHQQMLRDKEMAIEAFNALLQDENSHTVIFEPLSKIEPDLPQIENEAGYRLTADQVNLNKAMLKVEQNKLLPDITLGYFNGTNAYDNAQNYHGVHVGLALPLFFGSQKAKIDAARQSQLAAFYRQNDYKIRFEYALNSLLSELKKYSETLQYYEETGISLSEEIIEAATKSYEAGEIDFFRFVHSIENAIEIEIDYLDNLLKYNKAVLEINYLTL
ncbi:MAG TPA: TolC family protein, partial [Prolixibacteraceae bacterium]|nr:TolC family protein [Prolixibacteraceae bacterium]